MAKHWKAFFIGWVVCLLIFMAIPPSPWVSDPVFRFASAIGGTLPPVLLALISAGIGRMIRGNTAAGMGVGAVLASLFMVTYLVGEFY